MQSGVHQFCQVLYLFVLLAAASRVRGALYSARCCISLCRWLAASRVRGALYFVLVFGERSYERFKVYAGFRVKRGFSKAGFLLLLVLA